MLPLRGVIHTSPLSKGFSSYITTLCTSIGNIFPQAEGLVYHQPMGIALGFKAEWLLTPCRGSIQSYEVDDMLPLRGVYISILCIPRRCLWVYDMLPLRGVIHITFV
jgi:hypothetical protein